MHAPTRIERPLLATFESSGITSLSHLLCSTVCRVCTLAMGTAFKDDHSFILCIMPLPVLTHTHRGISQFIPKLYSLLDDVKQFIRKQVLGSPHCYSTGSPRSTAELNSTLWRATETCKLWEPNASIKLVTNLFHFHPQCHTLI